jgi:hypothetical protein
MSLPEKTMSTEFDRSIDAVREAAAVTQGGIGRLEDERWVTEPSSPEAVVILVRHGRTALNAAGVLRGRSSSLPSSWPGRGSG